MKIIITMELDAQFSDSGHAMGVTEEGYDRISEALGELGSDIDVSRAGADL
jgi:hypothetical protein